MKKIKKCRCCGSEDLYRYINLGKQPLANSYHKGEKLPRFPLEVMFCRNCAHSQLSVRVDPDAMFKNYLYVSGTTDTFRKHTKNLAKDAVKRVKKKKLEVLDIACNDGTQLEYFRDLGCLVMGVDPAENLRPITQKKNIPVVVDYWTKDVVKKINKKFDIITATNVFAHVDDIETFLENCRLALAKNGLIVLEFPYSYKMITNNEFDTVYHEHLSYFLVKSFAALIQRLNLRIVDIKQTKIHGGSIRFFVSQDNAKVSPKIKLLLKKEESAGLYDLNTYKKFALRVKKNKEDMRVLIKKLRAKKIKVVGYGASAKGNTMLNYFKIPLSYIVDDNELKNGFLTPGKNIKIFLPSKLKEEKNKLYVVILSWNFYNEILKKIVSIRGSQRHDHAVLYVPEVEVRLIDKKSLLSLSA